jgi:hypothetical protein
MTILTLNDGTTINVLETSNTSQINVSGNLEEVSRAMSEITTDSLKNADLAGTTLVNKVYTGFSGSKDGETYTVSFSMRDKTENEIIMERLDEQDAALVEIADMIGG